MTLKPSQILDRLNAKRKDFEQFDQNALQLLARYQASLNLFFDSRERDRADLLAQHQGNLGARPLESLKGAVRGVLPSQLEWQNKEESLKWVRDRLTGVTTFAVDGSQIYPGKDLSIPIALVQIGWFENRHLPTGGYEKDVAVDIMTPHDLKAGNSGEPVDRRVNMRRFQMETQRLVDYMKAHPHPEQCLVFLDGSLVATFARPFDDDTRRFYIHCLLELLRTSEQLRVPLVAYIDTTYAQDLTQMLQTLYELPKSDIIHDAQLLNRHMKWGDRTPLFQCQRSDILAEYEEQHSQIGFTYLKTTRDTYPARLEMPLWMYEAGLLDTVLDWVRAEVIIGGGYPYAIETADQTAVLQTGDRQVFYRLLQEWAEQESLNLRLSRKMVSKVRRR